MVLALTLAAVGFAFDAGSGGKSLTAAFSVCYAAGCILAVLAVRQSGVFTAVIQPPLILFLVVPTAYFVLTGGQIKGIKDVLINCGYPLIERFPLMFFTTGAVLLIGMVRWYFSASSRWAGRSGAKAADVADVAGIADLAAPTTTIKAAMDVPRRSRRNATARAERATTAEVDEPRRKPAKAPSTASRSPPQPPPGYRTGRTGRAPSQASTVRAPDRRAAARAASPPSRPTPRVSADSPADGPPQPVRAAGASRAARPRQASRALRASPSC